MSNSNDQMVDILEDNTYLNHVQICETIAKENLITSVQATKEWLKCSETYRAVKLNQQEHKNNLKTQRNLEGKIEKMRGRLEFMNNMEECMLTQYKLLNEFQIELACATEKLAIRENQLNENKLSKLKKFKEFVKESESVFKKTPWALKRDKTMIENRKLKIELALAKQTYSDFVENQAKLKEIRQMMFQNKVIQLVKNVTRIKEQELLYQSKLEEKRKLMKSITNQAAQLLAARTESSTFQSFNMPSQTLSLPMTTTRGPWGTPMIPQTPIVVLSQDRQYSSNKHCWDSTSNFSLQSSFTNRSTTSSVQNNNIIIRSTHHVVKNVPELQIDNEVMKVTSQTSHSSEQMKHTKITSPYFKKPNKTESSVKRKINKEDADNQLEGCNRPISGKTKTYKITKSMNKKESSDETLSKVSLSSAVTINKQQSKLEVNLIRSEDEATVTCGETSGNVEMIEDNENIYDIHQEQNQIAPECSQSAELLTETSLNVAATTNTPVDNTVPVSEDVLEESNLMTDITENDCEMDDNDTMGSLNFSGTSSPAHSSQDPFAFESNERNDEEGGTSIENTAGFMLPNTAANDNFSLNFSTENSFNNIFSFF